MRRQFNELKAAELYCPKCGLSQPVRERAVPDAPQPTLELLCFRCATVVGRHTVTDTSLRGKLSQTVNRLLGRRP